MAAVLGIDLAPFIAIAAADTVALIGAAGTPYTMPDGSTKRGIHEDDKSAPTAAPDAGSDQGEPAHRVLIHFKPDAAGSLYETGTITDQVTGRAYKVTSIDTYAPDGTIVMVTAVCNVLPR